MTDPYDGPTGRWGLIFHGSGLYRHAHTRQEWAQIVDAIRTADLLRSDGIRGDDAWCQTAVDTYTRLHDAGAYAHLRPGDAPRWHADEHLVRAWLGAPVVPASDESTTMLDAHGWQDTFDPQRAPDPADLTILVGVAQDAGVVGAPLHKVSLLRWVQDGVFRDDAFVVVLWPPDGPARASAAVGLHELLPASSSAVDRIVGVLSTVATVAGALMSASDAAASAAHRGRVQPAPATAVHERALSQGGRAFRLIPGGTDSAPPPTPPPPPTSRPPRRPRT